MRTQNEKIGLSRLSFCFYRMLQDITNRKFDYALTIQASRKEKKLTTTDLAPHNFCWPMPE